MKCFWVNYMPPLFGLSSTMSGEAAAKGLGAPQLSWGLRLIPTEVTTASSCCSTNWHKCWRYSPARWFLSRAVLIKLNLPLTQCLELTKGGSTLSSMLLVSKIQDYVSQTNQHLACAQRHCQHVTYVSRKPEVRDVPPRYYIYLLFFFLVFNHSQHLLWQ